MDTSNNGIGFIASHEGFVSRAYLDPVGILTIGYGFTMESGVFASYWRAKHGRRLQRTDTITRAEADEVLSRLLQEEYEPPVERMFGDMPQHQFDACVSAVYNLGSRALKWRWAKALKAGNVSEAARLLRKTGTTAQGVRLAGLVRRRGEEANLLEFGKYPDHTNADPRDAGIEEVQRQLQKLGHRPGPIDGIMGRRTREAVKRFQREAGLVVDGIPGPATRAALDRRTKGQTVRTLEAKTQPGSSGFFSALSALILKILELFK